MDGEQVYLGESLYYQQLSLCYNINSGRQSPWPCVNTTSGPNPPMPGSWLARRAAAAGIDLHQISLTEAADCAVSRLEEQRDAGLPLSPETVQLAALFVRLAGEWIASSASSAEPFVERAYLREWARLLTERHAANQQVWTRPPIPEPQPEREPEPEPMVTLYDLVREFRLILEQHHKHHTSSPNTAPTADDESSGSAQSH